MTDDVTHVVKPGAPLPETFLGGETFGELLAREKENSLLWDALYKRAEVPDSVVDRARRIRHHWHLLVLSEYWCGDSINTLPAIERLTEAVPLIDMRIISRDANPDIMDRHLTGISRSIPVIMVLDKGHFERGWWGPRPGPLQRWVVGHGLALPKDERYREVRTWYARDHGETAVNELLDIIERAESSEDRAETSG
ncbi:MAG: thioredoxin family protein [Gemmatimonadales bacterium]